MPGAWQNNVNFVSDGELVAAGVVGRPDRTIDNNVRYLKDLVDASSLGTAVFRPAVTLDPAVQVGQPVYWDATAQRFALALAAVSVDMSTGALVTAPSADCLGVVIYKQSANLGDVVTGGSYRVDISAAAGVAPAPGRYYLSASVAGGLTLQRPAVAIPILYLANDGYAYILPQSRNFLTDHVHYSVALACKPAGTTTPPSSGARHVISAADPTQAGWLPANHAVFGGGAPVGAAWGYNIAKDTNLAPLWPPVPPQASALVWDQGAGHVGGTLIPLGANGLAVIDTRGIWWMSDCNGDVPWPATYNSSSPPTPVPANGSTPECPRLEEMRLTLYYAKALYATNNATVTRLTPAPGSPITVTNLQGSPATTGPLELGLNLNLLVDPSVNPGPVALKTLGTTAFFGGYVVEGIAIDSTMTMTATHTGVDGAATAIGQGTVTLGVTPSPIARELAPQITKLEDVRERDYLSVPYFGFPSDRSSAIQLVFLIPPAGLPSVPLVTLRAVVLARGAGAIPALSLTYRRIPRPPSGGAALPTSDTVGTLTTGQTVTANLTVEIASAAIPVTAGDTLVVTVSRAGTDGYSSELGVLRFGGVLSA
jgi:hypothetical protein